MYDDVVEQIKDKYARLMGQADPDEGGEEQVLHGAAGGGGGEIVAATSQRTKQAFD